MPLKVLVVPDKFKGTLTARAAAEAIARGWRKARPDDLLRLLPMSDGGDGFGEVVSRLICAKEQGIKTVDAAHRSCLAKWWWEPKTKTAVVESAAVIGLAMLPPGRFHPFDLDTFGLGAVIRAAAVKDARRCVIGIGGSATNDGGFGLAHALGWEFLNGRGRSIERWTDLDALLKIRAPKQRRWFEELVVAVDVQNLLLGPRGATRVYGPQKGLRDEDFELAESCLRRLALISKKQFNRDFARERGAGAAGGLGFGLLAFLGARLEPGFELFAHHAALGQHLRWANLVITGEGSIDQSTVMGKGVGQIARRCRELKISCIALAGVVGANVRAGRFFTLASAMTEVTSRSQASRKPAFWLERLAAGVAKRWNPEVAVTGP